MSYLYGYFYFNSTKKQNGLYQSSNTILLKFLTYHICFWAGYNLFFRAQHSYDFCYRGYLIIY